MTASATTPQAADPSAPAAEFSGPPTKTFSVGVVGGGIAGVSLTLQLLRHGVPTTLYEGCAEFMEVGAGVSLGPNAMNALGLISPSLLAAVQKVAARPPPREHSDVWFDMRLASAPGASKHVKGGAEEKGGAAAAAAAAKAALHKKEPMPLIHALKCKGGQVSMLRAHLLDELVVRLPAGAARMNHRVVDCQQGEEGVVLRFDNGTEARHDAVIACDGVKSLLRQRVLGADDPAATAVFSGKQAYRGLIPFDVLREELGSDYDLGPQMFFGDGGYVLQYPLWQAGTMNIVAFRSKPGWNDERWQVPRTSEEVCADFAHFDDRVRKIVELIGPANAWGLFDHGRPASTLCAGRICIAGDAAHATTPHKGAGAGVAIEDAAILGALLGSPAVQSPADVEAAFRLYDSTRRPRGVRLVEDSRAQGQLYSFELEGIGADVAKIAESLEVRMRWLWEHDLARELEETREALRVQLQGK